MINSVYALFDVKACTYGHPFNAVNDLTAQRMVSAACDSSGSLLSTHPQDFRLMKLGEFDDQTGVLLPVLPSFISECSSLIGGTVCG